MTERLRLEDVARIGSGGRSGQTGFDFVEDGYPAYGAGGINGMLPGWEHENAAIVLSSIGARCGKCFYPEGKWSSLANTQLIFPDPSRVDRRFLWYVLNDESSWHRSGTAQPYIKPSDVKSRIVSLPPLPEQRRIASILDQADALRRLQQEEIEHVQLLLDNAFESHFPASDTSVIGTISDLLVSASYGTSAKAGSDGKWPVLRMGNVTSRGELDLRSMKYLDLTEAEVSRYVVQTGDVLFNRTNSPDLVGKSAVFRAADPMAYAGYLVRLRVKSGVDPEYLGAFLNSRRGKTTLRGMAKSIVGMANINAREVQAMSIPLPLEAAQSRFGAEVREIRRFRDLLAARTPLFDELFSSLQHRAFSGNL